MMNEKLLQDYAARLRKMMEEISSLDQLGADSQRTVQLDQQAVGRLSRMDALQGQSMAKATAARRGQQSQKILAALARIEDGEFGFCLDCGEDIAIGRLDFDPAITLCVSCSRW